MYKISKSYSFDAAHRLHHLEGAHKCRNLHGHTYTVTITLFSDTLNSDTMVKDFNDLAPFKRHLDTFYDHALIVDVNDIELRDLASNLGCKMSVVYGPTTSELLAKEMHKIAKSLFNWSEKIGIEVSETPTSKAYYEE